ncbi:LysR substrate-binding domain-containing protein [Enterovibrio sp. ZSDZ42]|uniref:LysR substrate-binding domain-containing protein n=1 Tax=Enterovibrio gelatinilyticus TaxID=2899819 RepID=A0ABT5QYS2_9GAMM|nr:LysR family transcriptional regulator [Enterovibrio sp. ZSDZ42]MDD1793163.1 LysR substrate-binding domain-containing protein [Enterovibrio sp. ZSDZ42]
MNIESKWLEDFLALAEVRNFSEAASVRNITQPAFSRRIRALEQAIGAELIDRSQTPVALTASGRIFRVTARTLVNQMVEGISHISALNYSDGSVVRIASAHSLALDLTQLIQAQFSDEIRPMLSVDAMNVDEAVDALQEGECDVLLAFDNEHLKLAPYEHIEVGHADLLPVCAVDEHGKPLFGFEQDDVPWLAFTPTSYMGRQTETVRHEVSLKPVFLSSMVDMLKLQAMNGFGVAWLPDFAIRSELVKGTLVVMENTTLIRKIAYYAYRYQSRLHPSGERIWSALKKIAADNPLNTDKKSIAGE